MAIVFEKWPRRVEIYAWDESAPNLEANLDQEHRVSNLSFLDLFDAQAFLRDLSADSDVLVQLREQTELLTYRDSSNQEAIIEQFAGLLANGIYRVRQYDFFRTAWPLPPPTPPAPPNPKPPPKRTDPPKPVENKAVLVEFVEVVDRGTEGVVTGPGEASTTLPTHVNRSDKNSGLYKQYVNIVDKDLEGQDKRHPEYGRYIEIKAKVTLDGKPKAGELVVFSFKVWRGDSCPALFTKDREGFGSSGGALTHSGTTDGEGWTETVKFYLSAYGGDFFELSAKGPDGKELRLGYYQVWRKVWCQVTHFKEHTLPNLSKVTTAFKKVFVQIEQANIVPLEENTLPKGSVYPDWMVEASADQALRFKKHLVIGGHNQEYFFSKFTQEKNHPVKVHLIVGRHLLHPETGPVEVEKFIIRSNPSQTLSVDKGFAYFLKPTLTGEPLVIKGLWESNEKQGTLTDDNILVEEPGRQNAWEYKVLLPADAPNPSISPVTITLQLRRAYQHEAAYNLGTHTLIRHYLDDVSADYFNCVVTHELAHGFNQVPIPGHQPQPLPNHPNAYSENNSPGYEHHCKTGAEKQYQLSPGESPKKSTPFEYINGKCVMFAGGAQDKKVIDFCSVCHPYIRLQNMEKPDGVR